MAIAEQVHWEEGLFLQHHHLQTMQRQVLQQLEAERLLLHAYPYGVISADLSRPELQNKLVVFRDLHVVMPSGLRVHVPGNADLPELDITRASKSASDPLLISLGVPRWHKARGNTLSGDAGADGLLKRLYSVRHLELYDENTGENPQRVGVRRINARLLVHDDSEDDDDLELLPLVRVVPGAGEDVGTPRPDYSFVPPSFVLHGSAALTRIARDLASDVEASRRELVEQLTRGGFSIETIRGMQIEQMLRLQTLSRFAAVLPSLVDSGATTPFQMYLELRRLLAELAALHPDRDAGAVSAYDHDHPYLPFSELAGDLQRNVEGRIRALLRGAVLPSYLKAEFTHDGIYETSLTEEHFARANDYYLGIRTGEDPLALAEIVEDGDKFKLMPKSMTGRAVYGVELKWNRQPPLQLPSPPDLHYFQLVRSKSERVWGRVTEEGALTAQWPGCDASDWKLTLFMTVAGGNEP